MRKCWHPLGRGKKGKAGIRGIGGIEKKRDDNMKRAIAIIITVLFLSQVFGGGKFFNPSEV